MQTIRNDIKRRAVLRRKVGNGIQSHFDQWLILQDYRHNDS